MGQACERIPPYHGRSTHRAGEGQGPGWLTTAAPWLSTHCSATCAVLLPCAAPTRCSSGPCSSADALLPSGEYDCITTPWARA
jgi:hypothetical protein